MTNLTLQRRFGIAVLAQRRRLGISQEDLAFRAGLHRTYISDIERGARNPSLASMQRVASGLEVLLTTLLTEQNGSPAASPAETVDILMVEDNHSDAALALRTFAAGRIADQVHVAYDGAAALEWLFGPEGWVHLPSPDRPRVILLDLKLPLVSGLEILRRLKLDVRTRAIPVVVLTASDQDSDIAECKRLGADAFLLKPVNFHRFSTVASQLSFHWVLLRHATATTTNAALRHQLPQS